MAINVSVLSVRGFDGGGENDPTMTGNNVTAGDLLLVGIAAGSVSAVESVSGVSYTSGPTFTEIGATGGFTDDWCRIQWFMAQVVSTASGVTINIDSTNFIFGGAVVLAVTGYDTTTPIVSGSVTQASAVSLSMPTRTSGGLRVAGWESWHDRTTTPNSGYTEAADTGGGFTLHAFYGLTDNQPAPTFSDTSTGFLAGFGFEVAEAAAPAGQGGIAIGEDEPEEEQEFVFATAGDTDNPPDQITVVVETNEEPLDEEFIAFPIDDGSDRQGAVWVDEEPEPDGEDWSVALAPDDIAGEPVPIWIDNEPETEPAEHTAVFASEDLATDDQITVLVDEGEPELEAEFVTALATDDVAPDQIPTLIEESEPEEEAETIVQAAVEGHDPAGIWIDEEEQEPEQQWARFDATDDVSIDLPLVMIAEEPEPEDEPFWNFPDAGAPPVASTDLPLGFLGDFEEEAPGEFYAAWLAGVAAQSTVQTLRFGGIGSTGALKFGGIGSSSAMTRPAWDARAVTGIVAWFDAYTSSTADSFGWARPTHATLIEASINADYTTGWSVPGMTVSLVTDGAQFLETATTGFHYSARTMENYWVNNSAVGAYTTVRAQFELLDASDRLLWTGDASTPPTTPVAFEAWWSDTAADARAGANIVSRTFETITSTKRRLTVTYRATGDSQAARFGVGRLGTLPSYAGNTAKGFRLYNPEVNQPKVTALFNRVSNIDAVQATLHGPQPGYESPLVRGIRGYGSQYLTTTEAALLAVLSGNDPSFTIMVTTKRVGSGSVQAILGARDSAGSKFQIGFDSSNRLTVVRDSATLTETSADAGLHQVITLLANGTGYTLRRNGSAVASGTVDAGALTMTGFDLLGNGAQGALYNGHIGDLLVFDRVLSGTELAYEEAGLAARLGV